MNTFSSFTHVNRRTLPFLLVAMLVSISARLQAAVVGTGAATAGGGRSTAGVYANQATLGQPAGPTASGGVYQLASGFQSSNARTAEPPPVPSAPLISFIADQIIDEDSASGPIPVTISDPDTPLAQLTINRLSSNPLLVRPTDIVFGGTASNRTLRITPRPNQSGSAIITITASDPQNHSTSESFLLEVLPVNDPPAILPVSDFTIESGQQGIVELTVNDIDDDPALLGVAALSDNPTLLPPGGLVLTGTGSRRQLAITPAIGRTGDARVGLQVTDPNGAMASMSFRVTVTPHIVRSQPNITKIVRLGGGHFRLSVIGEAGARLNLESSPSLGPNAVWRPESATAIGTGAEIEMDSDPSPGTARFYRVRAE